MKRALLMGINSYANFPSLRGCLGDTFDLARQLVNWCGCKHEEIRLLLNQDCASENIRLSIQLLAEESEFGDVPIIHYSGHGSQIKDKNGDEEDQLDEIICPSDINFDDQDTYITDDNLNELFKPFREKDIVPIVIMDCCHSGTNIRSINLSQPRYITPPDLYYQSRYRTMKVKQIAADETRNILLAACQPDETAAEAELDGELRGAFTYCLCRTIELHQGKLSYLELIEKTDQLMTYYGFPQTPCIEGPPKLLRKRIFERM